MTCSAPSGWNRLLLFFCACVAAFEHEVDSTPAEVVRYRLPLEFDSTGVVFQGNEQGPSHNDSFNRYAFDFSPVPVGTPIVAAAAGRVVFVKENTEGPTGNVSDNNAIVIQHADGNVSEYLHIVKDGAVVVVGDEVLAGDRIGYSGNTGNSQGPHLHFGLKAGSRTGPSVPCSFVDVAGDGVPKTGDAVKSQNFPVRDQDAYEGMLRALERLDLCERTGCLFASTESVAYLRKLSLKPQQTVVSAVLARRDAFLASYDAQAAKQVEAIEAARSGGDLVTAVRLVTLGLEDYSAAPVAGALKSALRKVQKEKGYHDATLLLDGEREYRRRFATAFRAQLEMEDDLRKSRQKTRPKRPFQSVATRFERALELAPAPFAEPLRKHIADLAARE